MKGTFTSIWDDGIEIITPAVLNTETGEITSEAAEVDNVDVLVREFFTDEDDNEYEICPECHEFILKSVMKDGIGSNYDEVSVCSNPDCENN